MIHNQSYQDGEHEFYDKARFVIHSLIALASADGIVTDQELLYIAMVGEHIGLDVEEIRKISVNRILDIDIPSSEEERLTILIYLMMLMKVDHVIAPAEIKVMFETGFRLGFSENMVRDFIELVKEHLHRKLPPKAIMEKMKRYMN